MKSLRLYLKTWCSIFFIALLLVLKCVELHGLTHDDNASTACTVCQLAHKQILDTDYLPPADIAFSPLPVDLSCDNPAILYRDVYTANPFFGLFLNKAPPLA